MKVAFRSLVLAASALAVLGFSWALASPGLPLGVPGEWAWTRITSRPPLIDLALGAFGLAAYALAVAWLAPSAASSSRPQNLLRVLALLPLGLFVQVALMWAAPLGYGLTRWVSLAMPGSSGYFEVAATEVNDLPAFLAEYPAWIKRQDALHIGTHPPGLVAWSHASTQFFERNPALARAVLAMAPASVHAGFREMITPFPGNALRAGIVVTGALVLLLCVAAAWPLYVLASVEVDPPSAWLAAALWPVVPSVVLFHPTFDTAFPVASTLALALAALSAQSSRGSLALALAAGVILGLGMQFTLAFLAVGLIAGLLAAGSSWRLKPWAVRVLLIGTGFLGVTLVFWAATRANPFAIWWTNQQNHARFYQEFPRSYLAWLAVNPVELAVGVGLPASLLIAAAFVLKAPGRRATLITLLVLALLTVSGRSLSEVARLWLPLLPPLLVAAGGASGALRFRRREVAFVVGLMGLEILALEAFVQVVYPVAG